MSRSNLTIVGIDPGTTLGYAILDIDGNILKVGSSKQLDLNSLIREIIDFGECIVVSSDVSKTPGFVKDFSNKLGARIIVPEYDLKVDEKRRMIGNFYVDDSHQRDALASAYFAYKKIKPLLEKIDSYLIREGKEYMGYEAKKSLIKQESPNIFSIVNKEEHKTLENKKKKRIKKSGYSAVEDRKYFLEDENKTLKNKIKFLENKTNKLILNVDIMADEKARMKGLNSENKIRFLYKQINELNNKVESLQSKVEILKKAIKGNDFIIVEKARNSIMEIQPDKKMIFVDDPNILGRKIIDLINDNVEFLICKTKPSMNTKENLNCSILDSDVLETIEFDDFVLVNKDKFNKEKGKIDVLAKVVGNYRKERLYSK